MKNKKIIIGIAIVLLVVALIYNLNKKPKVAKTDDTKKPVVPPGAAVPPATPSFDGYGGHDGMYGGNEDNYVLEDNLGGRKEKRKGPRGRGGSLKDKKSKKDRYTGDNILQAGADAAAEPTN